MRIQFISNYSQLYGANKVLFTIVSHFHKMGYEVSVLVPSKGGFCDELEKLKIPYTIIPYFSSFLYIKKSIKYLSLPLLYIINLITFPRIFSNVKHFKPDMIYSNTSAENFGIILAKLLKTKHISHIHEFMSLDHGALFIGGRKAKKEFIDKSNGAIYVTNCVAKHVNLGESLAENKIVIYNGVESPGITNSHRIQTKDINFGIVGILDKGKGQHIAIEYFKDLNYLYPGSKLHIFGDKNGSYKEYLKKRVSMLGLDESVIFHGFVNKATDIYGNIDILLMCSKSEGFGLVTIEAMMSGIPVLGFKNAGTAELIQHDVNGYLFTDKDSFLSSVNCIMEDDNYTRIKNNALEYANEKFSVISYGNKIEKFVNYIYINK